MLRDYVKYSLSLISHEHSKNLMDYITIIITVITSPVESLWTILLQHTMLYWSTC